VVSQTFWNQDKFNSEYPGVYFKDPGGSQVPILAMKVPGKMDLGHWVRTDVLQQLITPTGKRKVSLSQISPPLASQPSDKCQSPGIRDQRNIKTHSCWLTDFTELSHSVLN
jgi:hypothetical protein